MQENCEAAVAEAVLLEQTAAMHKADRSFHDAYHAYKVNSMFIVDDLTIDD